MLINCHLIKYIKFEKQYRANKNIIKPFVVQFGQVSPQSVFLSPNATSGTRDRGCNVAKDTSLHLEKPPYRRCPRNDAGSPRHYGAGSISGDTAPGRRGGAPECKRAFSRPSARDPDRVPLDLFAVNEIKGPIIEFFGKLLPPRPGSGLFSRDGLVSPESLLTPDLALPHVNSPVN